MHKLKLEVTSLVHFRYRMALQQTVSWAAVCLAVTVVLCVAGKETGGRRDQLLQERTAISQAIT